MFLHADSEDSDQTGQSLCRMHSNFVGFVMLWLKWFDCHSVADCFDILALVN